MTTHHEHLRKLVLAFEELAGAELDEARAHLAECAECRVLLARLQGHERSAGPQGELPAAALSAPIEAEERPAADASLAALRERIAASRPRVLRMPARPPGARMRWLIPVAAAAAVVAVWWLPGRETAVPVRDAGLVHAGGQRGEPGAAPAPDSVWRVGDAFEVRLELETPGWPVLVHVGRDGASQVLYPEAGRASNARLERGAQVLRPADPTSEWAIEGDPGAEEFLVAVAARRAPDRERLVRRIERESAAAGTTGARREAVRRVLTREVGPVHAFRITSQH